MSKPVELPPIEKRDFVMPHEAAQMIGCSLPTLHRLRHRKENPLRSFPRGLKAVAFMKKEIDRWREGGNQ